MNKWIVGARVKTLPAAVAPVLIGTSYAEKLIGATHSCSCCFTFFTNSS
ncbi:hypothetical protein EMGBS2_00170 [Actinomycetota bacterium]|nr:hypothetical protein EMGBS2_00170 [Actinomycetota bacterium]